MKILVAGATGFIGSTVALALREAGHDVVAVSRTRGRLAAELAHVAADVASSPLDASDFEGIDAIVNLVGIAIERGSNTFEAAHVRAVEHLLALAAALQVERFVHVSVVRSEASAGEYHRTKGDGEARVRESQSRWTILRPGLVYGPGDAMLSNLIRFATLAPVFVAPGGRTGPLQTVDVDDVALAVVRTLAQEDTIGATIDVVGSERFTLPQLVASVGSSLGLPTAVVRVPAGLMRLAASIMQRVLPHPPVTPTQLGMLIDGLYGEVEQTRALGIEPRTLTAERVREVAKTVRAPSLRLLPSADARDEASRWDVPPWFPLVAAAALLIGPWLLEDLWLRMLCLEALLAGGLVLLGAPLRRWFQPRGLLLGAAAGVVMVAGALGVIAGLRVLAPGLMRATVDVYGWASSWPPLATVGMLLVIAGAEDLVWRFGITLGLVRRLGAGGAVMVGGSLFAIAHATTGPPILMLAAWLAGLAWSALAVRTRAWLPVVTCHVLWDVSIVLLAP